MGIIVGTLIIPGLTIPNVYLNIVTTILTIVMVIFHYQFMQFFYWNKKKQQLVAEIEKNKPDLLDKLLDN